MGMKKSAILSSIATIALCAGTIAGSTWALFQEQTSQKIVISSASVEVTAQIDDRTIILNNPSADDSGRFSNGGTASVAEDGTLILSGITPGDGVTFDIGVSNEGNIPVNYSVKIVKPTAESNASDAQVALADALVVTTNLVTVGEDEKEILTPVGEKITAAAESSLVMRVTVLFAAGQTGVDYDSLQGVADSEISVVVEAVQANAEDVSN